MRSVRVSRTAEGKMRATGRSVSPDEVRDWEGTMAGTDTTGRERPI
jgi:hypothetical protein